MQQGTQVLSRLLEGHDQRKDMRTQHMTMHAVMVARMLKLSPVVPLKLSPLHVLAFLAIQRNT